MKCVKNILHKKGIEPIEFPYNIYYSNGTIMKTCTKNSTDRIKVETFYISGKKQKVYYETPLGKKQGMYASWYQNGTREELCIYKDSSICDEYAKWDSDGTLLRFGHYKDGRFIHQHMNV